MSETSSSDIRKRSRRYPGVGLAESIANARQVSAKLGAGQHSREDISKAIGSPNLSGASARKIASMASFGLLDKSGDGYAISNLGRRTLRPLPEEEGSLLREAFFSVDLYRDVMEAYKGDTKLPDALPIILERKFDIATGIGDYAAKVLRDSGYTAGVLDVDGTFLGIDKPVEIPPNSEDNRKPVDSPAQQVRDDARPGADVLRIELPQPYAIFETKRSLSGADKSRLLRWIDQVLKAQIEFLVEEDLGEN